jgi:hypothetical protein
MYYSHRLATGWDIGVARSADLRKWEFVGTLRSDPKIEKAHGGMAAPGAIVREKTVHLFYQTYPGNPAGIVHATSTDGARFEPHGTIDRPIVRPTGAWNNGRAIDADVVRWGDKLLMYWATRDPSGRVQMIGLSEAGVSTNLSSTSWKQVSIDGAILAPQKPTELDNRAGLSADALAWEGSCVEAPAAVVYEGRIYLFYAGNYNNVPQQIGVAVSDEGVQFRRLFAGKPLVAPGPAGSWNASESGHPFVFTDSDGQSYLFYQGDNTAERQPWRLSALKIKWERSSADVVPLPRVEPL